MRKELEILELEARLRPGQWSYDGFLGPTESLTSVMGKDDSSLKEAGLSHEQIASRLDLSGFRSIFCC